MGKHDFIGALPIHRFSALLGVVIAGMSLTASAWQFDAGDIKTDFKATLNYGVGIRTEKQSQDLINGPVDPFQVVVGQGTGAQTVTLTHTGLPTTINQDDGDRNFRKGALINHRLSALLEAHATFQNYGLVVTGDTFFDGVYYRLNDNDSPDTINKSGPVDQFTKEAKKYDGGRSRLLDAYVYGNWMLGENNIFDLRLGKQVVTWGESLFFPGIAGVQSPADATKAFTPGVEVKQILLPTNQIAANLAVGDRWTLMGYYKLQTKATEIFPAGDYLSISDSVGPGAEFTYGALNPLYLGGCPGVLPPPLSNICNLNGAGGTVIGAPKYIAVPYLGDRVPNSPQFGIGMKVQVTPNTSTGFYGLQYTDPNPAAVQNSGYPVIATSPVIITTEAIGEPETVSYYTTHFNKIKMGGVSYSTVIGPVSVAGEVNYRDGAAIAVQVKEADVVQPFFVRGNAIQAVTSAVYAGNPRFLFDDISVVGEVGYLAVTKVARTNGQPGAVPVDNGNKLFYDRTAYGVSMLALPTTRNVFEGWDLTLPMTFGWLFKGNPSIPGTFGALYGGGDMRISLGATLQYLQNLQVGFGYNIFLGDTKKTIGPSFLKQNPYTDRDYVAFNIKYQL